MSGKRNAEAVAILQKAIRSVQAGDQDLAVNGIVGAIAIIVGDSSDEKPAPISRPDKEPTRSPSHYGSYLSGLGGCTGGSVPLTI